MFSKAAQSLKDEAELKFMAEDYASALRFANLAKDLDPHLDGVEHFIAAYSVHVVAAAYSGRQMDWYEILGVTNAWVSTEAMKEQYKKMVLTLLVHPEKNKSVAAEGAFKLISEAWRVLSNPRERMDYTLKLSLDYFVERKSTSSSSSSSSSSSKKPLNVEAAQTLKDEAELNFKAQDCETALRFAIMAKNLDPNLDGIKQFIVAYSVHVASAAPAYPKRGMLNGNIIDSMGMKLGGGEKDWYAILGVTDVWGTTGSIKKQYKKIALMVHPDENNSVAADSAFKLISDAWNFLSDPKRRMAYNIRMGLDVFR